MNELRYNSYAAFFRRQFGERLQKVSIDAGFSCPNRNADNRSIGGCIFCNNSAFNPSYCSPSKSIAQQVDEGIDFHRNRYPDTKSYLAYFQPYSNTFAPLDELRKCYEEALSHPLVVGLIIGTRPDCVDEEKLDYIASLSERCSFVAVEYGIESCYDKTLAAIGRGHDFTATQRAVKMTRSRGLHCGAHLVLGLPGESRPMILEEANALNELGVDSLKLHQLQVIKGTRLELMADVAQDASADTARKALQAIGVCEEVTTMEGYIALVCDLLERLDGNIMMERFAGEVPPRFQALPLLAWRRKDGRLLRNEEVPQMVNRELERRNSFQGMLKKDF
ncbi:MAG: TIGR01212 family radical SAM protein [Bacteroidales bacterium]|nr:TIGR01212 family radical SAM protein [Bacteroidales bacterium]